MNFLLQADAVAASLKLADYGVLGIMALLFITAIIYLEKIRRSRDAEVRKEMDERRHETAQLKERFDKYQSEDRAKMLQVIEHNTDIMEEVVSILHKPRI